MEMLKHTLIGMGVSGCGKSTLAAGLALSLGCPLIEGDERHLPASQARMRQGIALQDSDREPWLERLRTLLLGLGDGSAVLACSSLGERFRERLSAGCSQIQFVFLKADPQLIARRLQRRQDHFMPASLIESQFAALDEPDDALIVDASQSPEAIVQRVRAALH